MFYVLLVLDTVLSASFDDPGNDLTIFSIDPKNEISYKGIRLDAPNVSIVDPNNRKSKGYNPFFALEGNPSAQEVFETMQEVAISMIPLPKGNSDQFWTISARNMMIGLFLYAYQVQELREFIECVDFVLSNPIKKTISDIIANSNSDALYYKFLIQFNDMADETISSIYAEMSNHLSIFATDQDLRYCLYYNENRISPLILESKNHFFLSIQEHKLAAYNQLLQLVINQTLDVLSRRPENSHRIVAIFEELPRVLASGGKIESLLDNLKTLRSKNVSCMIISQSIEALEIAYSPEEAIDLISNCGYIAVLQANSKRTIDMIISWCGKYQDLSTSLHAGIKWTDTSSNTTFVERDVVSAAEIMDLQNTGEMILIAALQGGYARLRKVPYYKDSHFRELASQIRSHNDNLLQK